MPMGVAEFSAATMGTRYLTPSSDEVSTSTNLGRWKLAATNMDSSRIRSPHNRIGQDTRVCYQDCAGFGSRKHSPLTAEIAHVETGVGFFFGKIFRRPLRSFRRQETDAGNRLKTSNEIH